MAIQITLANYHHGATGISLMRPSPLGNPFDWKGLGIATTALVRVADRDEALAQYALWLRLQMASETAAMAELQRLVALARRQPITLLCGCLPKPCHLVLVRDALTWLDAQPTFVPGVTPVPRLRYVAPLRPQHDLFG